MKNLSGLELAGTLITSITAKASTRAVFSKNAKTGSSVENKADNNLTGHFCFLLKAATDENVRV